MERRPNETEEDLAKRWLFRRYPAVFGQTYLPLAKGIHRQILANTRLPVSGNVLRKVIYRRTQYDRYLIALAASGALRHDLEGHPVAYASDEDRTEALARVRARRRKRQRPEPPQRRVVVVERRRRFQAVA
jgi:sRNA-binding protein